MVCYIVTGEETRNTAVGILKLLVGSGFWLCFIFVFFYFLLCGSLDLSINGLTNADLRNQQTAMAPLCY